MTRPEPRCLVTAATGQSPHPRFTLGDRSNPPRGDEVVCRVGISERWRGEEVRMGTITHRGGKRRRPCPTFAPRPPTDLLTYPRLFIAFFPFVRRRRYGPSLAAGGTAIYQIHWKSAMKPHLFNKDQHRPPGRSSSEKLLARR